MEGGDGNKPPALYFSAEELPEFRADLGLLRTVGSSASLAPAYKCWYCPLIFVTSFNTMPYSEQSPGSRFHSLRLLFQKRKNPKS